MDKKLSDLITQALTTLNEISAHPQYQAIKNQYSPDFTIPDAQQALLELSWELLPNYQKSEAIQYLKGA